MTLSHDCRFLWATKIKNVADARAPACDEKIPCRFRFQYFTAHPYGWLAAFATGRPAITSASATFT